MKKALTCLLWACVVMGRYADDSSVPLKKSNLCGEWTPYKDEKCLKIAERAGSQTQEDAEIICQAFSADLPGATKLLTVKTKEEQELVQWFLFVENQMVDNVWLGLKRRGSSFEWNDGSDVSFSNWDNQTLSDQQHECVEMESGDGVMAVGLWVRVSCKRKNAVVCEKRPSWSLETLQNSFLNFKLQQGMQQKEWERKLEQAEKKISELEQRNEASAQEIKQLQNNPVPKGFIYIQLASHLPPTTLWPATKWADVSSNYSGLFFRVVGDQSAPFGQIQEAGSKRLEQVQYTYPKTNDVNPITIPADGTWSSFVLTGRETGPGTIYLRFRLSTEEVRPRNQAVKIWQRIL